MSKEEITAADPTNPMREVYRQLGSIGLPQAYVRKNILPEWWDDAAAASPAGFVEAAMHLSRNLGLDHSKLVASQAVVPVAEGKVRLKKPSSTDAEDVQVAQRLATQVCRLASLGVTAPVAQLPTSGAEIRDQILAADTPWIGLQQLVDYCWSVGIPVLHITAFPSGVKRMHGMALKLNGRPCIVVSWAKKHPAWLLFVLAHELGHIALGHVEDNGLIVDQVIDKDSTDEEEKAANRFAGELLCGSDEVRFFASGKWPNAATLAERAKAIGSRNRIDPGHIVLNYANSMGESFFPVAQSALKMLGGQEDAATILRRKLASTLDWSELPEEASSFVARMTQKAEHSLA